MPSKAEEGDQAQVQDLSPLPGTLPSPCFSRTALSSQYDKIDKVAEEIDKLEQGIREHLDLLSEADRASIEDMKTLSVASTPKSTNLYDEIPI